MKPGNAYSVIYGPKARGSSHMRDQLQYNAIILSLNPVDVEAPDRTIFLIEFTWLATDEILQEHGIHPTGSLKLALAALDKWIMIAQLV